jgi:U4/U6.U5 tri-snRNP-associated protein 2
MRSPPTSPPAAKRARLDPDESFSTLPPTPSASTSTPSKTNGHAQVNGDLPPVATSAPVPAELNKSAIDTSDDEDEEDEPVPVQKLAEDEDLSRRDMYLDTVSLATQT